MTLLLGGGGSGLQSGLIGDSRIAVVTVAVGSTVGVHDVDFTQPLIGDVANVTACIVQTGVGTTAGTAVDGGSMSIGMSDGASSRMISMRAEHGPTTMNTAKRLHNDAVGVIMADDDDAAILTVRFKSFIQDGIRLEFDQASGAPAEGYFVSVMIIAGPGGAELIQTTTPSVADDVMTISPNYSSETRMVFCLADTGYIPVSSGAIAGNLISWGAAVNATGGDRNASVGYGSTDAAASGDPFTVVRDDRCMQLLSNSAILEGAEIGNYQTNGDFDLTSRGLGGRILSLLCVSIPARAELSTIMSPTSNGTGTDGSSGWWPQAMLQCGGVMQVVNTHGNGNPAGTFGAALFATNDGSGAAPITQASWTISDGNNQANADTQTIYSDETAGFPRPFHLGATAITVEVEAWNSTGYDYDYTSTKSTGRYFWQLTIEETEGPASDHQEHIRAVETVVPVFDRWVQVIDENVGLVEGVEGHVPIEHDVLNEGIALAESVLGASPSAGGTLDGIALVSESVVALLSAAPLPDAIVPTLQRTGSSAGSNLTQSSVGDGATRPIGVVTNG